MNKRNLRTLYDISQDDLIKIFEITKDIKTNPAKYTTAMQGKTMVMINEKQSLRTKVTFEAGIMQMGGYSVYLTNTDINLGVREPVKDVARNLSRWVDLIVARTFKQETIDELAEYGSIPVINALSDAGHPCQAIADLFTVWDQMYNQGSLYDFKLTYIGDGNNVCNSLILIAGLLGFQLIVCTPPGYEPDRIQIQQGRERSHHAGGAITFENDPKAAVKDSHAIYTDVWTSMGQEIETAKRKIDFADYQINKELLTNASEDAVVMHCLPAHRGEEITDDVLESDRSIVFDQAENRLHAQKAIMYFLTHADQL